MFCSSCGSMMFPDGDTYVCKSCGQIKEKGREQTIATKSENKEMTVIKEDVPTMPKTRIACPECSHSEAYFSLRQTRSADEPETRIYRCCKCSHTWREY
ncbi:MAG: transcription factor S [Candidatus Methanoplasma sp.]|nr:transcription factor S [Candidatus Methanoplasma sp.]